MTGAFEQVRTPEEVDLRVQVYLDVTTP